MIMAVASPQVELLISLFFFEDDVNFSYVSYISTSGITTLHTQDIFLEKIKNHANNLIGDHIRMAACVSRTLKMSLGEQWVQITFLFRYENTKFTYSRHQQAPVHGGSSQLWTEKYKPKRVKDIIGQQGDKSNVKKLLHWLQVFHLCKRC